MARASDPELARLAATWIVRVLRDHGHMAYFAGGCVRDGLLGLHPTDFDVATDAAPQRVRELFPRTAEVGAAFGVVLVRVPAKELGPAPGVNRGGGVTVEVATFRADGPYSDARRPDRVTFSDPKSDAERRDFTINALFLDPIAPTDDPALPGASDLKGLIIDFVGGLDDLRRRVLRAVGDPDKRLAEDHLRALRAVRFSSRLGFALDPATAAAITRHAAELRGVSRERVGEELRRMLAHPSRPDALAMLESLGLDAPVLNEPHRVARLTITRALSGPQRIGPALAAWLIDRASGDAPALPAADALRQTVRRWRAAMCLSNDESSDLLDIADTAITLRDIWPGATVALRKRIAAKRSFAHALRIWSVIDPRAATTITQDASELQKDGIGLGPEPLVTGDDLVSSGKSPGPRFKQVLDRVYDAQLEGVVRTKQEAMELAAKLFV